MAGMKHSVNKRKTAIVFLDTSSLTDLLNLGEVFIVSNDILERVVRTLIVSS